MIENAWFAIAHNFGTKVISVVIAIVLWVVVLGSRNVEVTKEIPLEIITSGELTAANDVPEKIAFRLAGPKAFLRAVLDRREDPIRVNLAGAKPGFITYRFFSDNIRLPIGVKVLSINPTAILIKLEPIKKRDVPVRVELKGQPADGFRVAKAEAHPPVVRIKGAETKVDAVTEVGTIPIDVTGLKQEQEREAALDLTRYGLQIDGVLPKVLIDVEPLSANLKIKNIEIRVLSSFHAKLDQSSATVFVRADPANAKLLDRNHVYAVVDLRGKPKGVYRNEGLHVSLPPDTGLVRVTPDKVNVTLY
jgi:YbbR domain-containing protein